MAENNKNKNKVQIDPTYAHLQPQAVNVEQAVLGALMIDSDAFSVVSELLKPDTFYDPRHKRIYQAIQVMNMEERPVDIMTLADQLAKTGELDKVGGAQYLMDISARHGFGCPCRVACPYPGAEIYAAPADSLCRRHRDDGV